MSQAKALFDAGKLKEATEVLLGEVKSYPNDIPRRSFLFELSCFAGDWDRAERQLDVIGHQSEQAEMGVVVYRNLIKAERERRRLVSEGVQPHFLTEPPSYVDMHLDALTRLREGKHEEARAALDAAEEERPAFTGKLNGRPFQDIRDYDDFFGPVLEVIVQDKYTWIPLEQVLRMNVEEPKHLRDLLWIGASIQTTDKTLKAYLPALYPNSSEHETDAVRLGRMTDWQEVGPELYRAAGMHLFIVDGEEEKGLLEVRNLVLGAGAQEEVEEAGGGEKSQAADSEG